MATTYKAPWTSNTAHGHGKRCGPENEKNDLPPKLRIHLTISSKWSKILHDNTMVQSIGNTHLYIRDYTHLHATINCKSNQHDNMMSNPLVKKNTHPIPSVQGTEVFFCRPGVSAVLKELKHMHDRMVMELKNAGEMTTCQKKTALQYFMFLK